MIEFGSEENIRRKYHFGIIFVTRAGNRREGLVKVRFFKISGLRLG
jgi:hypothetical protein